MATSSSWCSGSTTAPTRCGEAVQRPGLDHGPRRHRQGASIEAIGGCSPFSSRIVSSSASCAGRRRSAARRPRGHAGLGHCGEVAQDVRALGLVHRGRRAGLRADLGELGAVLVDVPVVHVDEVMGQDAADALPGPSFRLSRRYRTARLLPVLLPFCYGRRVRRSSRSGGEAPEQAIWLLGAVAQQVRAGDS